MKLNTITPIKSVNKAYLKEKVSRIDIEIFKKNLIGLFGKINETESEEHLKNLVSEFLKDTWYKETNEINTKGRNDLVIHTGKTTKESVGVILEVKKPSNKSEMMSSAKPNSKAMHELILYYLRERIEHNNIDIKYLVVTNIYEWFIIDEVWFEKNVYRNIKLRKDFDNWKNSGNDTRFFYESIAKPFLESVDEIVTCTYFDIRDYKSIIENESKLDDHKLISLYKILSPVHLLKQPFANDSNSLDTKFYTELLHLIGLEEVSDGNKKLIKQKAKSEAASLLENTIIKLEDKDCLRNISNLSTYGTTKKEQAFNIALELCITWVNRVLFLKLLEAQLYTYNKGNKDYLFLNTKTIFDFDELSNLFFQVLAEKPSNRRKHVQEKFSKIPYLNSSLFERTELERQSFDISALDNRLELPLHDKSVLKKSSHRSKTEKLPVLQYLFEFLEAYDFSSEGSEEIQEENKNLINASVLGLIFEKINGYKDGSFFTPGFVTMHMCEDSIKRTIIQKFNEIKGWKCKTIKALYDKIEDKKEANEIINKIKLCDPAVGSGHFLVSALNTIIAIKSELKILLDKDGKTLRDYHIEVVNDELIITNEEGLLFDYNPKNKESQRIQKALFHEKETIIENCLFGVDINPNSVKICRLRLWIELLKNAYYTEESNYLELETLPNIDINIKCGNSLISRFSLDADLSKALKKSKWNIDSYRIAVETYRNAENKEQKREMEKLIDDIKSNFRTEIGNNDPKIKRLQKLGNELYDKYTGVKLFSEKLTEAQKKDRKEIEAEIKKLSTEIEEIKSNKIFENAFEWRFEFPEILNNNGNFIGFDIIIGNPPYVDIKALNPDHVKYYFSVFKTTANRINLYSIFVELSHSLLKTEGEFTFIIPNSILVNSSYQPIRNLIAREVRSVIKLPDKVFPDAIVETIILSFQKGSDFDSVDIIRYKNIEKIDQIDTERLYKVQKEIWFSFQDVKFNIYLTDEIQKVISKCHTDYIPLGELADFALGITPYDKYKGHSEATIKNREYHSSTKKDKTYKPLIDGENIIRFKVKDVIKEYIKYGDWLGAPREERFFTSPRVIVRQIVSGKPPRIYAGYTDKSLYFTQIGFAIIPKSTPSAKVITAILNSKLMNFIHKFLYLDIEKELFQKILIENCKQFPIKNSKKSTASQIEKKVDEMISCDSNCEKIESKIDDLIYELYELNEEEIKIVEGN